MFGEQHFRLTPKRRSNRGDGRPLDDVVRMGRLNNGSRIRGDAILALIRILLAVTADFRFISPDCYILEMLY